MADISKRIEKAEKFLKKGKTDSALEEYLSVLDVDPGNDNVRHTAADLFLQINRGAEASALLSELFDRQVAMGDNDRAAVTYKKLARIGPPKLGQVLRYAQAAERGGSRREALDAYDSAVKGFLHEGRENEALSAMRRMAALDPDPERLKRLASLASKLNDRQTAAEAFLKIGVVEEQNGRSAFPWFERAYQQDAENPNIAFRFGKALLDKGDIDRATKVLQPALKAKGALAEHRQACGLALIAAHRPAEAYDILWPLYEKNVGKLEDIALLLAELLDQQQYRQALELTRKLDAQQESLGKGREFIAFLREITRSHPPDADFLEYMVGRFNSANREHEYCEALIQLCQLRYAAGDFHRAADALDRAADVDPYIQDLGRKLQLLRGKIDPTRYRSIASRLRHADIEPADSSSSADSRAEVNPQRTAETPQRAEQMSEQSDAESTVLEDLMLQAEIFLQYAMRVKALERLERIQKLFPREEEKNQKLRRLYISAGVTPDYQTNKMVPAAPASANKSGPIKPIAPAPSRGEAVDDFARVTEITRNIHRQSTVKSVLFVAINDVGRHWNASRCIAGLCSPGKPPSAALEYCAPGVKQADVMSIVRLIGVLQNLAVQHGSVAIENAAAASELNAVREHVNALELKSVLACPLMDADQQVGILILGQGDKPRAWRSTDTVVLKTIAEQMVLAVNNAKLRSLMKTLAVTDEKSGLLKRASYIDVMTAEVKRSMQQNTPMTLMLLNFGKASALTREGGEAALEAVMQNVGQSLSANIRQTDTALRYDRTTIALVLGDTKDANGSFVVDKLRKAVASVKAPGTGKPISMTVGIAGAVTHKDYDPADIVTEVINRAEQALDMALSHGPNSAHSLAPSIENAVVA